MHATQLQVGDELAAPTEVITAVETVQEADLLGPITVIRVTTTAGRTRSWTGDPWISIRRGGRSC